MNINYKETQIDFLSHVSGKADIPASPRYMAARISLSLENLVILSIIAIMIVVFSFSLGIERGKSVVKNGGVSSSFAEKPSSMAAVSGENEEKKTEEKADSKPDKLLAGSSPVLVKRADPGNVRSEADPGNGAYTLQVASYKNLGPAQREADKLKQKGFQHVYVLPKGTYTIVCVGKFQNKEDVSTIKKKLSGRYQDSRIRRL